MKTPITDKFSDYPRDFLPSDKLIHADLARRLELDRAALMEALEGAVSLFDYSSLDRGIGTATPDGIKRLKARSALSTARANFP